MPSGRTHGLITTLAAAPVFVSALLLTSDSTLALCTGGGCLLGLLIEPDLDHDNENTASEARARRLFGPFASFWLLPWRIYGKAIKHRHWLSHGPIIGTAIRWLYLSFWILLPMIILSFTAEWDLTPIVTGVPPKYYLATFLGNALSDFLHWSADTITGFWR